MAGDAAVHIELGHLDAVGIHGPINEGGGVEIVDARGLVLHVSVMVLEGYPVPEGKGNVVDHILCIGVAQSLTLYFPSARERFPVVHRAVTKARVGREKVEVLEFPFNSLFGMRTVVPAEVYPRIHDRVTLDSELVPERQVVVLVEGLSTVEGVCICLPPFTGGLDKELRLLTG